MIEVEVKLKIENIESVKNKLVQLGFIEQDTVTETDTYFDSKNSDIRNNDRALRIRETVNHTNGSRFCQINFKDKKYDNKSMTRPEFETVVQDAEAITNILSGLGYYPVEPKVIKLRRELNLETHSVNACLDTVEGLGDYLELEICLENEASNNPSSILSKDDALNIINGILTRLGYSMEDTTTVSYLGALEKLAL